MTPFGVKIRDWRQRKNRTLHQQADALGVSAAYLSALETGTRGRPSAVLVDQICVWLGLIWDDAEELKRLAALSHPKPTINARGQSAEAIYMVNFLAQNIDRLSAPIAAPLRMSLPLVCNKLVMKRHQSPSYFPTGLWFCRYQFCLMQVVRKGAAKSANRAF